jgi:predicted aspartyl protease
VYITGEPGSANSANPEERGTPRSITSSPNMVNVDVDLGYGPVEAMVDSGNSWPISMSEILADMLVKRNLAIRAGSAKSEFADGIIHNVDIILIKQIAVEGRVLRDVEASVSHGPARILLGMGALNRLGPFKIDKGRFVFTGVQPT